MASVILFNPSFHPLKSRPKLKLLYSKYPPSTIKTGASFPPQCSSRNSKKRLKVCAVNEDDRESTSSSTATVIPKDEESSSGSENLGSVGAGEKKGEDELEKARLQENDGKTDEEFKKFMGNPSIEAAIKLEKKRVDRKLKELDIETDSNPISGFFKRVARDRLAKERERLEEAEEAFKALDHNKLKGCFGFDTFFDVDVRRFGDGGILIANLRNPIEEVIPNWRRNSRRQLVEK